MITSFLYSYFVDTMIGCDNPDCEIKWWVGWLIKLSHFLNRFHLSCLNMKKNSVYWFILWFEMRWSILYLIFGLKIGQGGWEVVLSFLFSSHHQPRRRRRGRRRSKEWDKELNTNKREEKNEID